MGVDNVGFASPVRSFWRNGARYTASGQKCAGPSLYVSRIMGARVSASLLLSHLDAHARRSTSNLSADTRLMRGTQNGYRLPLFRTELVSAQLPNPCCEVRSQWFVAICL